MNIDAQIASSRDNLIARMRNLADDLQKHAKRLEENPDYRVNSLGVIQNAGLFIDVECAKYMALRGVKEDQEA